MGHDAHQHPPKALDRLDACAAAGIAAAVFAVAAGLMICAHLIIHQRAATPRQTVMARALGTLTPSLMPAGSPYRLTQQRQRSVDLRHSPGIPLPSVDPAGLLVDLNASYGPKESSP